MTQKQAIRRLDDGEKDFETWFTAQYGPEPKFNPLDLRNAEVRVDELRAQAERAVEWSTRREAARMAWTAARGAGIGIDPEPGNMGLL